MRLRVRGDARSAAVYGHDHGHKHELATGQKLLPKQAVNFTVEGGLKVAVHSSESSL